MTAPTAHLAVGRDIQFLADVATELEQARANFPDMNSLHEGYAVILEELDELWAQVRRKPSVRSPAEIRRELVQVAAMAARTANDCFPDAGVEPPSEVTGTPSMRRGTSKGVVRQPRRSVS